MRYMVNQQLIDWIKSEEAQGYTLQQLYNSLIQQGYDANEVNEAMRSVYQQSQKTRPSSEPIKKPFNFLPVIIIGVIIVGLAGGGIFFFTSQEHKAGSEIIHRSINKTNDLMDAGGNKVGEVNTKIGADVEVTTDCGGMDCFKQKFSECKPATVSSKLTDNIVYFYEIIGPKDGLCEVKSKFTANPNPKWVGKEMTCKYDNTKNFETAVQDMSNCQGPLYTLMTGG